MSASVFRRARPMLGTLVEIRVEGLVETDATQAVDAAFAEIEIIHRCMSFHLTDSDVSRLNRDAANVPTKVDARTAEVVWRAREFSRVSQGCFDISVATELVGWGALPAPSERVPQGDANWRDIIFQDETSISFRRPLWIDLGGIAKGYAVDRAIEILMLSGAQQACVNAGGDLRIAGLRSEAVHVRGFDGSRSAHALEVRDAAVAGSSSASAARGSVAQEMHVDGISRTAAPARRAVGVVAANCCDADALTKIVLSAPPELTRDLLAQFNAQAALQNENHGWQLIGAAA